MLLTGNIQESSEKESENKKIMETLKYNHFEWNNYLLYGGYPIYFTEKNTRKIRDKIVGMTQKVVKTDSFCFTLD